MLASGALYGQSPTTYMAYTGTDVKTLPSPPLLGAANTTHADPTFGSQILRVTDQNTNGGQSFISTDAGEHRAWNANSTAIKLTGPHGDGWWMEFNPATFKVGDGSSNPKPHSVPYGATWEWSVTNPDVIYVIHGNKIASYNKSTGVTTDLGGPSTGESPAYMAVVIGLDNWVCAAAGAGQQDTWNKLFCIQPGNTANYKFVDINGKTVNGAPAPSDPNWPNSGVGIHGLGGGTGDHWLSITFHGQNWGGNGDAVFNLNTNTWSLVKGQQVSGGDIFWGGHVMQGNGQFANGAGNQGGQDSRGVVLRNPDNLMNSAQYHFVGQPAAPYNGWCDAEHSSWFNSTSNPGAPIIQSRYGGNSGCAFNWTGEILGIAVDQSNTVYRFAHNYNLGSCYYAQAFAQVSNDGKWVLFSSIWGGQLGSDSAFGCSTRIDTFIIALTSGDTPTPPVVPVLAFTQQPSNTQTTMAITPAIAGTLAPAAAHSLTLAPNTGNCTLNGTLTVMSNGSTGVWSFPGVTASAASPPQNCTLKVIDNTNGSVAMLVSNSFNVTAANPVETVTMTVGAPCQVQGTTTVQVVGGSWSFPGVTVSTTSPPQTCTMTITDSDSTVAPITGQFTVLSNVVPLPVLAITQQPTDTLTGMAITPAIAGTITPAAAHSLTMSVGPLTAAQRKAGARASSNCNLSGPLTVTSDASTGAWSFPSVLATAIEPPAVCTVLIHDNSLTGAAVDIVSAPFTITGNEPPPPTPLPPLTRYPVPHGP